MMGADAMIEELAPDPLGRGADGARRGARGRRARDDARRARLPRAGGRRGRARERGRVRAAGAVPATIGVLDGKLARRARRRPSSSASRPDARKLGPRDLAACAVQGAVGATTVGGTLAAAGAAGIRFMGTGGLGGVHRGFPTPPDVSADLAALARTPAVVVSLRRQVAARRAGDGRAARDARRAGDRLPHRHAAALLRRRRRPAGLRPRRVGRARSPGSPTRTGASAATRSSSAGRRTRASSVDAADRGGGRRGAAARHRGPGGHAVRARLPARATAAARRAGSTAT